MKLIRITFLQIFLFDEIFMYKIYLESPNNINETIEIVTHDVNEALDELLKFRDIIVKQNNKWKTDFISIMIPTNNIEHAISMLLDFRTKRFDLNNRSEDIYMPSEKYIIKHLNITYSDDSISPINILEDMKTKNNSLNQLINNLNLEILP
jgi:hypothetical protein